ncbi:MAG: HAD-IC family P-type ATPase, partial [Candidatus Bipolaricaulota bacterium]|nr:HAD-IC family P-type ATPase [Candidatus Bipolaricaulota bacterium]
MDERTEDLQIEGMHCAGCADELEQAITRLHGVTEAKVNFAASTLRVRYRASAVNRAQLVEHLKRIGYTTRRTHEEESEPKSLWQRREALFTGISGALLALGLVLSVLKLDPTLLMLFGRALSLSTVLYLTSVLFGAYHFARKGLYALKTFSLGINALMSLAIVGAIIIGEYVEAASLAFLFSLAELLEEFSVERARRSLRELIKLAPSEARVRRNGEELWLPLDQIKLDETLIVKPGERIALDGRVLVGNSSVNQAPITGESIPVEKMPGDEVFAGAINGTGAIEVEVTTTAQNNSLARIVHIVEAEQSRKGSTQRLTDRIAKPLVPGVLILGALIAILGAIFGDPAFWIERALVVLVAASPCALAIAVPVTVISAIGAASKFGVVIKSGEAFEQ